MAWQQGDTITIKEGGKSKYNSDGDYIGKQYPEYEWNGTAWVATGEYEYTHLGFGETADTDFNTLAEANTAMISGESKTWGAPNINKDMFINADGTQKTIEQIYTTLDPLLTNITGKELVSYINDILPKFQGVPTEEKERVERGREEDIYKLQGEAGKVAQGADMGTGSGVGVRGQIASTSAIAKGFETAQKDYEYGLYGLEKKAGEAFETDVGKTLEQDWFKTPDTGAKTEEWGSFFGSYKQGGKVPNKEETFLDILTKLPDATGS